MHRVQKGLLPLMLAAASPAAASSFIEPTALSGESSPSIIMLGTFESSIIEANPLGGAEADVTIYAIGTSLIALGADAIPTASERVASIGDETEPARPRWLGEDLPLVMRGGIVGEARPAVPVNAPEPMAGHSANPTSEPARTERRDPPGEGAEENAPSSGAEPAAPPTGVMR